MKQKKMDVKIECLPLNGTLQLRCAEMYHANN